MREQDNFGDLNPEASSFLDPRRDVDAPRPPRKIYFVKLPLVDKARAAGGALVKGAGEVAGWVGDQLHKTAVKAVEITNEIKRDASNPPYYRQQVLDNINPRFRAKAEEYIDDWELKHPGEVFKATEASVKFLNDTLIHTLDTNLTEGPTVVAEFTTRDNTEVLDTDKGLVRYVSYPAMIGGAYVDVKKLFNDTDKRATALDARSKQYETAFGELYTNGELGKLTKKLLWIKNFYDDMINRNEGTDPLSGLALHAGTLDEFMTYGEVLDMRVSDKLEKIINSRVESLGIAAGDEGHRLRDLFVLVPGKGFDRYRDYVDPADHSKGFKLVTLEERVFGPGKQKSDDVLEMAFYYFLRAMGEHEGYSNEEMIAYAETGKTDEGLALTGHFDAFLGRRALFAKSWYPAESKKIKNASRLYPIELFAGIRGEKWNPISFTPEDRVMVIDGSGAAVPYTDTLMRRSDNGTWFDQLGIDDLTFFTQFESGADIGRFLNKQACPYRLYMLRVGRAAKIVDWLITNNTTTHPVRTMDIHKEFLQDQLFANYYKNVTRRREKEAQWKGFLAQREVADLLKLGVKVDQIIHDVNMFDARAEWDLGTKIALELAKLGIDYETNWLGLGSEEVARIWLDQVIGCDYSVWEDLEDGVDSNGRPISKLQLWQNFVNCDPSAGTGAGHEGFGVTAKVYLYKKFGYFQPGEEGEPPLLTFDDVLKFAGMRVVRGGDGRQHLEMFDGLSFQDDASRPNDRGKQVIADGSAYDRYLKDRRRGLSPEKYAALASLFNTPGRPNEPMPGSADYGRTFAVRQYLKLVDGMVKDAVGWMLMEAHPLHYFAFDSDFGLVGTDQDPLYVNYRDLASLKQAHHDIANRRRYAIAPEEVHIRRFCQVRQFLAADGSRIDCVRASSESIRSDYLRSMDIYEDGWLALSEVLDNNLPVYMVNKSVGLAYGAQDVAAGTKPPFDFGYNPWQMWLPDVVVQLSYGFVYRRVEMQARDNFHTKHGIPLREDNPVHQRWLLADTHELWNSTNAHLVVATPIDNGEFLYWMNKRVDIYNDRVAASLPLLLGCTGTFVEDTSGNLFPDSGVVQKFRYDCERAGVGDEKTGKHLTTQDEQSVKSVLSTILTYAQVQFLGGIPVIPTGEIVKSVTQNRGTDLVRQLKITGVGTAASAAIGFLFQNVDALIATASPLAVFVGGLASTVFVAAKYGRDRGPGEDSFPRGFKAAEPIEPAVIYLEASPYRPVQWVGAKARKAFELVAHGTKGSTKNLAAFQEGHPKYDCVVDMKQFGSADGKQDVVGHTLSTYAKDYYGVQKAEVLT
jgi:hypothetical protein